MFSFVKEEGGESYKYGSGSSLQIALIWKHFKLVERKTQEIGGLNCVMYPKINFNFIYL